MKKKEGPGKAHREGISLIQLAQMFPDEESATKWLEETRWPEDRPCPRCGDCDTYRMKSGKPMPFRCRGCWRFFSVRTGTVMERSHIPLQKWVWGIYLYMTSLKSVSAMKLHRDLSITYQSAWFMAHRLREAMTSETSLFSGPVEADEVYMGGKRKNMPLRKRRKMTGRGPVGKTAVIGVKDRPTKQVQAKVIKDTKHETLRSFLLNRIHPETILYTDDSGAYAPMPNHDSVKHSRQEYVRGAVHTNGIESFWSMLKRAHMGTFHKLSAKHLHRYLAEFVGRDNMRDRDTLDQMRELVCRMGGRRLMYRDLIADNGLDSGARN